MHIGMHRIARLFATRVRGIVEDAASHLKPVLEERRAKMEEYGADYPDKPVRYGHTSVLT